MPYYNYHYISRELQQRRVKSESLICRNYLSIIILKFARENDFVSKIVFIEKLQNLKSVVITVLGCSPMASQNLAKHSAKWRDCIKVSDMIPK